jgi:hypothetical protein
MHNVLIESTSEKKKKTRRKKNIEKAKRSQLILKENRKFAVAGGCNFIL